MKCKILNGGLNKSACAKKKGAIYMLKIIITKLKE